ncbi:hypothetical protein PRECH8_10580 [Insulibacter thermoxylanivorax]|uniref:Uncharacterized protein n=1 Tax=Insulibacter thermoxylanivorax TaxID=2749268 RepID=A0A916VEZ7_9BACL|nr:hypothetical protein PRECH8_10580 [Insulibacter thermoxylanivorax]
MRVVLANISCSDACFTMRHAPFPSRGCKGTILDTDHNLYYINESIYGCQADFLVTSMNRKKTDDSTARDSSAIVH